MLSYETERRLAKFLWVLAEGEKAVEQSRQDLCLSADFGVYLAFDAIDRLSVRVLSAFDLKDFVSKAGVHVSHENLELLVKQYDSNNDARISLDDFSQLVLPSESVSLRERTEARTLGGPLTFRMQQALARHLALEGETQGELEALKRDLAAVTGSSSLDAFKALDREGLNYVSPWQIKDFMRRNGYVFLDRDVDGIIRRVDTCGDGRLSYSEFVEGIAVSRIAYSSPMRSSSPLRDSGYKTFSPYRSSSPLRTPSPFRASNPPVRESYTASPVRYSSPLRSSSPSRRSEAFASPPERSLRTTLFTPAPAASDMNEIVSTFKSQVSLARDLEAAKLSLAAQFDFSVRDFFRLVDLNDQGYVLSTDLEGLLNDFSVLVSPNDVYLLIRHFSSVQDSRLRMNDFEEMVTPKDKYYASLLAGRTPLLSPPLNRMSMFSALTQDKITSALRLFVQCERTAEDLRKSLSVKRWINLLDIFRAIDKNEDGYITIDEFENLLRDFGVYVNEKDLEGLVDRYDKNFDGKVSYSEFISEVTPKLA